MTVFVDTSALYALLDRDDENHLVAAKEWQQLLDRGDALVTHNYVLVETVALAQRRLGMAAVRTLLDEILPVVGFFWVDQALHQDAVIALLAAGRRDLSLVDWVSFEGMRQKGIQKAFAFDEDFQAQGFVVVPSTG